MANGISNTKSGPQQTYRVLPQGQEELTEYSIKEFEGWRESLTADELKAVEEYGLDSSRINDYFRGGNVAQKYADLAEKLKPDIDKAINKHQLSENVVVYRGVGTNYLGLDLSSEAGIKSLVGKEIKDPAYLSTTAMQGVSDIYQRGAIFKINAPKGKNCAFADLAGSTVQQLREFAQDGDAGNHEYLFGRNSKLKITGYSKRKINGKDVWEIHADLK